MFFNGSCPTRGSSGILCLRKMANRPKLPIRILAATSHQYKVEILATANKFTKGQITSVPREDVQIIAAPQ